MPIGKNPTNLRPKSTDPLGKRGCCPLQRGGRRCARIGDKVLGMLNLHTEGEARCRVGEALPHDGSCFRLQVRGGLRHQGCSRVYTEVFKISNVSIPILTHISYLQYLGG